MVNIRSNYINLAFERDEGYQHPQAYPSVEFVEYGQDILESEQLTDSVYEFLIGMMAKRWEAGFLVRHGLTIKDVGMFYTNGIYMPCVKRFSFTREVDLQNDGLPHTVCVGNCIRSKDPDEPMRAYMVRRIYRHPHGMVFPPKVIAKYRLVIRVPKGEELLDVQDSYFGINKQGHVVTPVYQQYTASSMLDVKSLIEAWGSVVINAGADSRYLWLARCEEDIGFPNPMKLVLGLDPEHIKSLFYARKLPVTESGRKRPILHWVRAHKRRLREGIEIDISKYLRGIETFDMDGLRFEIIQPTKPAVGVAKIVM